VGVAELSYCRPGTFQLGKVEFWRPPPWEANPVLAVNSQGQRLLWQEGGGWAARTTGTPGRKAVHMSGIKLRSELIDLVRMAYVGKGSILR